jgi:hypothetical protein
MRVAACLTTFAIAVSTAAAGASATTRDELHRPLHLPHLKLGRRCPVSPSRVWTSEQRLNGRGPVYLVGVGGAPGGTIDVGMAFPDSMGWFGQKTPWAIDRSYDGPLLVRARRIGKRGAVRFARGYGDHLPELYWPAGVDQGSPPDPKFRFLASTTLFRAAGCYAFQLDGTSFSKIIVARVRS